MKTILNENVGLPKNVRYNFDNLNLTKGEKKMFIKNNL